MPQSKSFEIIETYKTILQKHQNYLEQFYPEKLANIYLELSFYYSDIHNQKYEIAYTEKAIALMDKTQKYSLQDYLTAYNDWYYYVSNYDDNKESNRIYLKFDIFYKKLLTNPIAIDSKNLNYARRIYDKMYILEKLKSNLLDDAHLKLEAFYNRIFKAKEIEQQDDISFYMSCYDAFTYKYYENKDYVNAIKYLKELQKQGKQFKLPFYEMKANALLGSIFYYLQEFEKGKKHSELALQNFEFSAFSSSKYSIETIKALNLSGLNKNDEAAKIVERIVSEVSTQYLKNEASILTLDIDKIKELNSHQYINIFASSSLIFKKKYQKSHKLLDLQKAEKLATIASLMFQEFYKNGEYNLTLSGLQNKITETLLFICSQNKTSTTKKVLLLNLIERNVSQHLFKEVQKKILLENSKLAELYNELEQLQNEKIYFEGLIQETDKNTKKKVEYLALEIEKTKNELKLKYPNFMQVDDDFDIAVIQKKLKEKEQIWKFYVADEYVYSLCLSPKQLEIHSLGQIKLIKPLTLNWVQQLKKPNSLVQQQANQLKSILFPKKLQTEKLAIIPDNFLNYVPFEAILNTSSNDSFKAISYSYSFPMWMLSKKQGTDKTKLELASFAPNYGTNTWFNNQKVQHLPFAQKESETISALFNGTSFQNKNATKENFLNSNSPFNVYHFAMHSFLYEDDFSRSCLLFSNNQPLYFSELYNHYIPADLLVLSACDTGNGKLVKGEGIMSLARAFTYAGVKSSVVSLWQVPDKETSEIMILFYENLKKGLPKDEALALAKQEFIKQNPLKNHPYFWAGFIINGDVSPICKSFIYYWLLGGLLTIALAVIFCLKYHSKSRNKSRA
ncbi:CHAT domain-containing protein [Flavobacterium terrae]|nr:CHAT domain-containing protein [Flavobacterium terrae]